MTFDELKDLQAEYEKDVFSIKGIHGIGIGIENGNSGSSLQIIIYAENQSAVNELRRTYLFSKNSVPYQVIIEPPLTPDILYIDDNSIVSSDQGRYRPLIGGIQLYLQNKRQAWMGTLGTFVKSKDTADNNLYILTNLHVLEERGLAVSQPLYGSNNVIGMVSETKEFSNTDAALAIVNEPNDVKINVIEEIGTVNKAKSVTVDDLGKRVIKRGRTTIITEGTIESVNYSSFISGKYRTDCVSVRADPGKLFSNAGDSGSPVILKQSKELIGLHFAGNKELGGRSVFCKMSNIFENLNVKLPD